MRSTIEKSARDRLKADNRRSWHGVVEGEDGTNELMASITCVMVESRGFSLYMVLTRLAGADTAFLEGA